MHDACQQALHLGLGAAARSFELLINIPRECLGGARLAACIQEALERLVECVKKVDVVLHRTGEHGCKALME